MGRVVVRLLVALGLVARGGWWCGCWWRWGWGWWHGEGGGAVAGGAGAGGTGRVAGWRESDRERENVKGTERERQKT
uniref:Uncharacterized protein n=1 Tax=Fagus sylvatica TaxID=28930 RepID=A0A2N9IRT9_FAGSY